MYQDQVAVLNAAMRLDPDIFLRGVTFAVLSIRQQFITLADQMRQVDAVSLNARALWGYKRGSYDYLRKHKVELWEMVKSANDSETAIAALTAIPGIGIVKAAFVCQMMGHDIGCLDSRNITRLNLNPREWRSDGNVNKTSLAFRNKIGRYVAATAGQAETLWNDWCKDVARVYAVTAEQISQDHLVIVPKEAFKRAVASAVNVPCLKREAVPF